MKMKIIRPINFLYEQLNVTHTQKMNEFGLVITDMQQFTKENAELEEQNRTIEGTAG